MVLIATDLPEPVVPATKKMGHAGQVDDHRVARRRSSCRAQSGRRWFDLPKSSLARKLAQMRGRCRRTLVRQFDADGVAALNHRHTGRDRRHRAGDIVGEPDHPRGFPMPGAGSSS